MIFFEVSREGRVLRVYRGGWILRVYRGGWVLRVYRGGWVLRVYREGWVLRVYREGWVLWGSLISELNHQVQSDTLTHNLSGVLFFLMFLFGTIRLYYLIVDNCSVNLKNVKIYL